MNPSLLLIPDRYKAAKLYSQIPDSGAGDLTFARNSNATRVNSAGLIEKVRTNLVLNSATLATQDVTVTANAHTVSFFGTGSIVVSGVASGTLVGTGVGDRVELIFTATAGTLNLTVSGTVTNAQLEISDFGATDYIPTTTAAVSVGITADIPRLDYTGGGCPSLLLEPQRTNLVLYSEQWDNAYWSKFNDSVSANAGTSPDGYANADKEIPNTSNDIHGIIRYVDSQSAGAYTASVFLKAAGYNFGYLRFTTDTDTKRYVVVINLTTGAVTATNSFGSPVSPSSKVENYGNGWYRLSVTLTHGSGDLAMMAGSSSTAVPTFGASIPSFAGDGTSGVLLYGAMAELGAYPTSYIPTLGASVTRLADAASKTGISSLLSASEYTLFWEGTHIPTGQFNSFMTISQTSNANNSARFYRNNTDNQIRAAIFNSVNGLIIDIGSGITTQTAKCALRVKAGSYAFYVNGTLVGSTANALTPSDTLDQIDLQYLDSTQSFDQKTDQVLFFKTGLTNAELQSLTSL
jgi:hypothetical protein